MRKKILCIVASILLLMSAVSLCYYDTDTNTAPYLVLEENDLKTYETADFLNGKSLLKLEISGQQPTLLVMTFSEDLPEDELPEGFARLYYACNGSYHHLQYADGHNLEKSNTVYFMVSLPDEERNTLYFDMDTEYTPVQCAFYEMSGESVTLQWNYIATGVLLATLLLLVVFEKKLGFFAAIKSYLCRELALCRTYRSEKRRLCLALHIAAITATAALLLTVVISLAFNLYTVATVILSFVLACAAVGLQLADRILSGNGAAPAKLFLVVALLSGLMMCLVLPPCTRIGWDDEIHYNETRILSGIVDREYTLMDWKLQTSCRCSFNNNNKSFNNRAFFMNPDAFIRQMVEEDSILLDYELDTPNPNAILGYLPMAAVMSGATLLGADIAKTVILTRLCNLLIYAAVIYFAIGKLKRGGYILSAIALLSCPLFMACIFKTDHFMIAWFAYGFAYLFSELQQPEKKLTTSDMVKILGAFFLACSPKILYCAMLLPLLFIGKNKFETPKQQKYFRIATVLLVVILLAILFLPGIFLYDLYTDTRGGADVNSTDQILYILTHPFSYIHVLLEYWGDFISLNEFNVWNNTYGYGYLGATGTWHATLALILLVYCIFTDRTEGDGYELKPFKQMRPAVWLTCILQIILICTSMYVGFTPVGANYISGVQFRYLFPFLFPICYFLTPSGITCNINEKFQKFFVFGGLALNFLAGFLNTYIQVFFWSM